MAMAGKKFLKIVFVDQRAARIQARNFFVIVVHADYGVSQFSKARGSNEAHIAGTNHRYPHRTSKRRMLPGGFLSIQENSAISQTHCAK